MRAIAVVVLLAALLAAAAACAPAARAGTYDVFACRYGGSGPNSSWTGYSDYGGNVTTAPECLYRVGIWGNISAVSPVLSQTGFHFRAPSGTRITEFDISNQLVWAGDGWASQIDDHPSGGTAYAFSCPGLPGLPGYLNCAGNDTGWQRLYRTGLWAPGLRATIYCVGNPCGGGWVTGRWRDLRVRLYNDTPPVLSNVAATGGWVRGSEAVGFTASDDVGIRQVQITGPDGAYRLNQTRPCDDTYAVPCPPATTASTTIDTTKLANGAHVFGLRAIDSADNWGGASRTINVDNSAPAATLSRRASDFGRTVTWTVTDAHSGVDGGSLAAAYSIDNGATWAPMSGSSWSGGTFSAAVPAGVPDGRIKVRVSGRDNASPGGNGFTSDAATVVLDRAPPVTKLDGAGNPDVPHPGPITVTLSATDALSGMGAAPDDAPATAGAHVAYRLDGGGWTVVRGDEADVPVAGAGTHTLGYYAVDAAGNRSAEASRTIRIGAATAAPGLQAGFWHRTRNPLSTFTAAKRFGPPCPAAATLTAGRDAAIAEADPNATPAALQVGPPTSRRDSLVAFPLPAAPDCTVESARLRLYASSWTAGYPGRAISATRASSSWDEPSVSWNVRPGTVGASATATVPATAGWMEWDVTAQVLAMYRYGDNGLYLRDAGPAAGGLALSFCSRENTTPPCEQPQLVVRFSQ
jgi:hypothetical protein